MIGTILGGRYTILEEVGKGGMAHVYKAQCNVLNRTVAVKMLRNDLEGDEEFVNRFNAEAQAAAGLAHPNIVSIYDVGEENGIYYIVMEYIEGITLKEYIKSKGKLSSLESAEISSQICAALTVAHEKNIIHRDIKPHNIMVTGNGLIKVTDFGIARASNNATMQVGDSILGSVHYISPEQARGGYIDCRSDIYSLGIVLYEMLTGKVPFESESPIAIAMKHLEEMPVAPQALVPDVSGELQEVVLKAISKETRKRYQTVSSMKSDLDVIINMLKAPSQEAVSVSTTADNSENMENTTVIPLVSNYREKVETTPVKADDNIQNEEEATISDVVIDYDSGNNGNNSAPDNVVMFENEVLPVDMNSDDLSSNNDESEVILDEAEEEFYDEDDYEERGGISVGTVLSAIIISVLIVTVAGLFIGYLVAPEAPIYTMVRGMFGDNDVEVPAFVGKQYEEAKNIAQQNNVRIEVIETEFGPEASGIVTQQSISAGNTVKKGTIVNLHTSKGPDPELFSTKSFEDEPESVIIKYEKLGYNILRKYRVDTDKDSGDIISVELDGNKITFYINKNEGEDGEEMIKVPDLSNLTVNQARAELEDAGLLLLEEDEYDTVETSDYTEGRVCRQSESAGNMVEPKTKIKIYLAKKPSGSDNGNNPSNNVKTKIIKLDLTAFKSSTTVKILDPTGKSVFEKTVDSSSTPELSITLEGKGTVNYVVYINGSEYCKYPVNFDK